MEFNPLEAAVLMSALERYQSFCAVCLKNPENEQQFTFIQHDLELAISLYSRFRAAFPTVAALQ